MIDGLTRWFLFFFCGYEWARRWHGGKWELWYCVDPVEGDVWFHVLDFWKNAGDRKPCSLCRGRPMEREMWEA